MMGNALCGGVRKLLLSKQSSIGTTSEQYMSNHYSVNLVLYVAPSEQGAALCPIQEVTTGNVPTGTSFFTVCQVQAGSSIKPKIPSDANVHAVFES